MKKLLSVLLSALLMVTVISGCQSTQGTTPGSASGAQNGAAAQEISGDKAIIRMLLSASADELALFKSAVDTFNEKSEKSYVELTGMPGDGFIEKLITALNSNTPPDVFVAEEAGFGEMALKGHLYDVGAFLEAGQYGLTKDQVPPSLIDSYTIDGKLYGVPTDSNPLVIYYNADLISEVGARNPQELYDAGQWNFAAMQEIAEKLKAAGKVGFAYENVWFSTYMMTNAANSPMFSTDGSSSNFDSPRALAGLQYLENNIRSGAFTFVGSVQSVESVDALFMSKQAGMITAGRWFVPSFSELDFSWDVVPVPYFNTPDDVSAPIPALPLTISAKTKIPELAWEFVSYYCGEEGQRIRMEGEGTAVPTIPGMEDLVMTGTPEHDEYFLDALNYSVGYTAEEATHPGLTDDIAAEMELLLVGDQDAATTSANLKALADDYLSK